MMKELVAVVVGVDRTGEMKDVRRVRSEMEQVAQRVRERMRNEGEETDLKRLQHRPNQP